MRKIYVLAIVLLMAAVLALPGTAQSAMWVGGELGVNLMPNTDIDLKVGGFGTFHFKDVAFQPSVIGGITIGYDFVNTGFAGGNWPDWMKYFSFATDFTYNKSDINSQFVHTTFSGFSGKTFFPITGAGFNTGTRAEGYLAAWTFLFMGHYGFFPDSEVPAGRLHPYIGVGPCILFSGLNLPGLGDNSQTNIALVTEAGVRFMALKNVSLDLSFRYRFASPTYEYRDPGTFTGIPGTKLTASLDANEFSILTRVSYHF